MIGPRPNTAGGLGLSLPTGVHLPMRGLDGGGPLRHFSARECAEVQEFSTILSHGRRTPNDAVSSIRRIDGPRWRAAAVGLS